MYFGEYGDFCYNSGEQISEIFLRIPEHIIVAITASLAVHLLAGHPEGTAGETVLNVSL